MKSLKSIAQQKDFDLKKLTDIAEKLAETIDVAPIKMGATLIFSNEDCKTLIQTYYEKYPIQVN